MSVEPVPPLLLASTSPQRRAILEQLGIPFDVIAPDYVEHDPPEADAQRLVRGHAQGKARSVAAHADGRPVLGVDTTVVLDGRIYAKAADAADAEQTLAELSGKTHAVMSGLCLLTPDWEVVEAAATLVTFRVLTSREVLAYVASGEWEGEPARMRSRAVARPSSSASTAITTTSSDYRCRCSCASSPSAFLTRTASASARTGGG